MNNNGIHEPPSIKPKTTVLGIGGAGVKTLKYLSNLRGSKWLNLAVADADDNALNQAALENSFPVGTEWTYGLGCGGDPMRGASAFAHPTQKDIEKFISGSSMLIVTGGFGGGAATGGAPIVGRLAKRLKIPTIFLMTMPFAFEGHSRHEIATGGLKLLLPDANFVIPIPNDILFSSLQSDAPARQAFSMVDESLSHAILGLTEVMRCDNLLSTDFSDFESILGNKKTICRIGLGLAGAEDGKNRCNLAIERLLDSPLLGGESSLTEADAVIVTVIGGSDLEIGEMKQSLEIMLNLIRKECRVFTGINTDSLYDEQIFITLLAVTYDDKKLKPKIEEKKQTQQWFTASSEDEKKPLLQPELGFQSQSRGHFSKTSKNVVDSEDLDIPPFQRMDIILDKGH